MGYTQYTATKPSYPKKQDNRQRIHYLHNNLFEQYAYLATHIKNYVLTDKLRLKQEY